LNRSWFFGAYLAIVLLSLCAVQIIIDSAGEKDGNSAVLDEKREYMIFIEIEDKTLYLLDGNTCVKEYRIASGNPATRRRWDAGRSSKKETGAKASGEDGWDWTFRGENTVSMVPGRAVR